MIIAIVLGIVVKTIGAGTSGGKFHVVFTQPKSGAELETRLAAHYRWQEKAVYQAQANVGQLTQGCSAMEKFQKS